MASCVDKPVQYDASVTPYKDGKKCAISFTYDDGMLCQYTDVAPELEKRGFRGTFWIIGANMGKDESGYPWMNWDQVADLAKRGHEMSNHTWNHPSLPNLTAEELEMEVMKCDSMLEAVTGQRPITLAYPYNAMSPEVVNFCERGRVATRTFQEGHGQKESHSTVETMTAWMNHLLEAGEWGVTMTHGTTYGWDMWDDPTQLWQFYDVVKSHEESVWVGTYAEVATYLKQRDCAEVSVEGTSHAATIKVGLNDDYTFAISPVTISLKGSDWSGKQPEAKQDQKACKVVNLGDELLITMLPGDSPVEVKW